MFAPPPDTIDKGIFMRVLITGGDGRLGRWVGRDLRDNGHEVVSVDRHLPSTREPGIHYQQVEMSDLGQIIGALAGCDVLIHLAAIPAPYSHPDEVVFLNNVGATYNALQAAMTLGIKRAIIASSVSAYGMAWARPTFPPVYAPIDEDHPFLSHEPYALSKETDERTAEMFTRRCGMTVLAYRLHWIAGPGEASRRANDPGYSPEQDATNLWGYVDVRDAARAFRLGLDADLTGFTAFNIVADDTLRKEPTEELVRTMLPTTELRGRLSGNASGWCTTRARALLGFVPEHSWRNERGN
jgi:nucleoside-diphosphate-sugar epimerase